MQKKGACFLSQGPSAPPHPIAVFPPPCVNMQHTLIQKYTHTLSYRDAQMHTDAQMHGCAHVQTHSCRDAHTETYSYTEVQTVSQTSKHFMINTSELTWYQQQGWLLRIQKMSSYIKPTLSTSHLLPSTPSPTLSFFTPSLVHIPFTHSCLPP